MYEFEVVNESHVEIIALVMICLLDDYLVMMINSFFILSVV